jgi:Na+/melibiose symporter-like transporter
MSIANILMVIFTGQLITRAGPPGGYQLALGLSVVLGLTSAFFYSRLREPRLEPLPPSERATLSPAIFRPLLENRPLLMLCATAALWNFALNITGPFFSVYMAKHLLLTPAVIGLLATVSSLSGLPAQRLMGPLTDRLGPYRVQLIMGFLIPLLPFAWIFITRPDWAPWQITLVNIAGGFLWAAYSLASFNLLLLFTPTEQRARTSAIYQVIVSISLALGAAAGSLIVSLWGFAAVFLTSAIIRWAAAILFARFVKAPDPHP